jgi:ApaG protein
MVQQVTEGIKISVQTRFEGTFYSNQKKQYAFAYTITIENLGKTAVQLTSRFWKIRDSLNRTEIVQGEGVIGQKPVILPGRHHTYSSGCLLESPIGSMQGFYQMVNLATAQPFRVKIPNFKLHATFAMN